MMRPRVGADCRGGGMKRVAKWLWRWYCRHLRDDLTLWALVRLYTGEKRG